MVAINLDQSYKTVCKFCGLVKQSLIPGNFVCGKCKTFCEQQLSGEALCDRDNEVIKMLQTGKPSCKSEGKFLDRILDHLQFRTHYHISNQQYLSVCRILKKEIK